jgi:hypothetical protein
MTALIAPAAESERRELSQSHVKLAKEEVDRNKT